jgi:hypothetical protein
MWLALLMLLAALLTMALATLMASPADARAWPQISVSPQAVSPGTSVSTTGSGFPKRAKGNLFFGGKVVATFITSRKGHFSTQWMVPEGASSGKVVAKVSSRQASAALEVRTTPPPPPPPGRQQLWSDPATWNNQVPEEGYTVTIPADKTVLLDASPPALKSLQVDGTLIFEDKDLELKADWVVVHGKLQIGTEEAPFTKQAKITLTGNDPNQNVMSMGAKVLGVMGGTLDIHGEQRSGWTRLNATSNKGSNKLTLEDASGWRVGDRIAVASTD